MSEPGDDQDQAKDEAPSDAVNGPVAPQNWGRQLVGAFIGGAVALMLGAAALQLGWVQGNLTRFVLWGGVVGGLIGGSEALASAGQRLTKRDSPVLNIIVALVGMAVVFSVLFAVVYWLSILIRQIMGR